MSKKYPDFFPIGCPPSDAVSDEKNVYRLIKTDKIDKSDFLSFMEEGKDARHPSFPFIEYGISVNTDFEELKKYWRGSPALKKMFNNIASGTTCKNSGVIKATPTRNQLHHHTWWLCEGASPEKFFKKV